MHAIRLRSVWERHVPQRFDHYVGSEIRAVILNKMMVDTQDDVCVIGGESIAIETALIAAEERSWQLSTMVRTETRWKTM